MKILIYAHLFPPSQGGIQNSNLEIARGLKNIGHNIRVIACYNKGIRKFVSNLPFPVRIIPKWPFANMSSISPKGILNWAFLPWYSFVIHYELKSFKPDILLVTDETSNAFWGAIVSHFKVPYISYCSVPLLRRHRINPSYSLLKKFKVSIYNFIKNCLSNSYHRAMSLIVTSNSTKNEIIHEEQTLSDKIAIVPRSIDDKFYQPRHRSDILGTLRRRLRISKTDFILLSITRLSLRKGLDDVIKAMSIMDKSTLCSLRYVIVGEGDAMSYLAELTENFGLTENVIFVGGVPHTEIVPYYDICDLFVLPPRRGPKESFGRVFAEAAARSKPSIASKDGGMVDVIDDGQTGLLVSPGDIEKIRNNIEYLMRNKDVLQILGKNARLKAEKCYTSQSIAKQFDHYIKGALRQVQESMK